METAASLSPPLLPRRPFSVKSPCQRRSPLLPACRNVNVTAMGGTNGRDYGGGKLVDENMIVLRMRIHEIQLLETKYVPPSDWMKWEKQYYAHYDSDIYEAVGLLQSYLMNTRPSLAIGIAALIALSVPISTVVVLFHAIEIAKGIVSGFYLS